MRKRPHSPSSQGEALPTEPLPPLHTLSIDVKSCGNLVPSEEGGKQQHVVEILDIIDEGTSILIDAHVRPDLTAETVSIAMLKTFRAIGLPTCIRMDRDPRFVGSPQGSDFPSPFIRALKNLKIKTLICPPRRPDKNGFIERYHRTFEYECLRVKRPGTLEAVKQDTSVFHKHYNYERPNQARSCQNKPPCVAFPVLPILRSIPEIIDPDFWIEDMDGERFSRKVRSNGTVSIDNRRYYIDYLWYGRTVTLRIDGKKRVFVVEYNEQFVKEIAIKGLVGHPMRFDDYERLWLQEARSQAIIGRPIGRQLPLPLETPDSSEAETTTM